jgi:hypothetical protein
MQTSPLRSGDELPNHPDHTTALKVLNYGKVYDDADGHELMRGLHRAEITMLMSGQKGGLDHLYRYAMVNGHIYHTRSLVTVECECVSVDTDGTV